MVTVSGCISDYPRSLGRKVFWEILSSPVLEVCAVRTLQTAFEVEAPGGFERAEFGVQREYHHEACDPVHPVVGCPVLEVAERGFHDVRRHIVNILLGIQEGSFLPEVSEHHPGEPGKPVSTSHQTAVDDAGAFLGRFAGKAFGLAYGEDLLIALRGFLKFLHQRAVLPYEVIHLPLLWRKFVRGFNHIPGPVDPAEHVHISGQSPHVAGHQIVHIGEGVVSGVADGFGKGDILFVPVIYGLKERAEGVADVPVAVKLRIFQPLDEGRPVVRHGILGRMAGSLGDSVHGIHNVGAVVRGGRMDVDDLHVGVSQRLSGMSRGCLEREEYLVFGNGDAFIHDNGIGFVHGKVLAPVRIGVEPRFQDPVAHRVVGGYLQAKEREHEVEHLHALSHSPEAITTVYIQKHRRLDYFFFEPVSFDITQAITSDDLLSRPASISFFDVIHTFPRDLFGTPDALRLCLQPFGLFGHLPFLHPLDPALEVVVLVTQLFDFLLK